MYSDLEENISLMIRAQSGTAFLAPMQMQICQPSKSMLSVRRSGRAAKDLVLSGHVEMINYALRWIQYLGNENFYGNDIISLYAMNIHGVEAAQVSVFVEPINDPPVIHAPNFIMLKMKETSDGQQLFDKQRDAFEFSIGDTDIFSFPGNRSHLAVTFSLEVDDGHLSTSLPVHLIETVELKSKSSNQWQPLQSFVTISNHFVLKGKGVRFRGTIGDCNNAMHHLFYHGVQQSATLTITVNDLGNYGCYPDCTDMMSLPLFAETTVNLIRRRPISSLTALLLGSAIVLEIVMMLLLGGALLLFICKCMSALHRGREEHLDDKIMDGQLFQHISSSKSLKRWQSSSQHGSRRRVKEEESRKNEQPSPSQINSDPQVPIPLSTADL